MEKTFDCAGYATKANLRCSDGRVIMPDAFKECDGKTVPLVWNHQHNEPENVLGHALLENRKDGVYTYCTFNDTEAGQLAKRLVKHKDVTQFSIYANRLKEVGKNVVHGMIREVSLVLAGANPGAFIDSVIVHNADGTDVEDPEQGIIWIGEDAADLIISHEDDGKDSDDGDETIGDILNTLSDKQKIAVGAVIDELVNKDSKDDSDDEKEESSDESKDEDEDKDEDKEDENDEKLKHSDEENEEEEVVKHNVFDDETQEVKKNVLSHSDGVNIIKMAKDFGGGSLKAAIEAYATANGKSLSHADGDDDEPTDLGFDNISTLFPEYKDVRPGAPEMLTTDQGWISTVMKKVHKSPISRIRTRQTDARDISDRRAKGYKKQTQKGFIGNLKLLGRTTDPTTIYVKSKLDRDDVIDITDFDVVQYLYNSDRMNLNEEIATAIMLGDGREEGTEGKIDETKIRPIWTDDELYTIHVDVDIAKMRAELQGTNTRANFGENYIYAEAIIQSLLYARENYKGSGSPDFFCTPHLVNVMLLARDLNGRRIYDNVNELKAALNVNSIVTAEQFVNRTRKVTVDSVEHTKELLGLMINLSDYSLGSTKGGEITHFTDFDLNFNQHISLLETRLSGANTRPLSAIALEMDVTESSDDEGGDEGNS